jgi:hypothetical protein
LQVGFELLDKLAGFGAAKTAARRDVAAHADLVGAFQQCARQGVGRGRGRCGYCVADGASGCATATMGGSSIRLSK